jgi:hypothetical protein
VGGEQSVEELVKAVAALEMVDADRQLELPLTTCRAEAGGPPAVPGKAAIAKTALLLAASIPFASTGSSSSGVMRMRSRSQSDWWPIAAAGPV